MVVNTMNKVNIKDVAAYAGVSPSSVSRYISNPNSINPIPAMKIEQAIKTLGYIPNTFAQSLKRGHSNTVGFIVPVLGPFYSQICSALSDFFYQHHYLLFICETQDEAEKERYFINSLLGQQVAGLIIAPSGGNDAFLQKINQQFTNIILLDNYNDKLPFDSVYEDNYDSSYRLTKHLLEKGHRHIISLFRSELSTNTKQRMQGASKAFEEMNLDFQNSYIQYIDRNEKNFSQMISSLLTKTPKPTAIIAYSPLYLENTLTAINQLGLVVPQDVELAGYTLDDFSIKYKMDIPSVIQTPYDMGLIAGDMLLKKLRKGGGGLPKEHCIPMRLNLPEKKEKL